MLPKFSCFNVFGSDGRKKTAASVKSNGGFCSAMRCKSQWWIFSKEVCIQTVFSAKTTISCHFEHFLIKVAYQLQHLSNLLVSVTSFDKITWLNMKQKRTSSACLAFHGYFVSALLPSYWSLQTSCRVNMLTSTYKFNTLLIIIIVLSINSLQLIPTRVCWGIEPISTAIGQEVGLPWTGH